MLSTDRLIQLRKQRGMTQEQVAAMLNTSRPNYVRYERGNHQPPNEVLGTLAELFNVSTDYLLGKTDNPAPPQKEKNSDSSEATSDGAIKFALFGDKDIDDDVLDEVKRFAKYIKDKHYDTD